MASSALIVADIGNSRMKWGRCGADRVQATAALPLYDLEPWQKQLAAWGDAPRQWALAASNPLALERFAAWLEVNDEPFRVLREPTDFPVKIDVEKREQVGKDRLANAAAYVGLRLPQERKPAVIVDAGSAVTVDYVDEAGVFRGGAILPGLSMMAKALNYYTTRLPLVEMPPTPPEGIGRNTEAAMRLGIAAAAIGAVRALEAAYRKPVKGEVRLILTGGDAMFLEREFHAVVWPEMTLEGLRLAASRS